MKINFLTGRGLAALAGLVAVAGLGGCGAPTDSAIDLPTIDKASGVEYIDTLTVRTATVLVDSVVTSGSGTMLLGRYTDARFGTLTARGFARLGLTDGAFEPAATARYDSLVVFLAADSYRYGDTTRTQQIQVHRLREPVRTATTYYAFSTLRYDPQALGSRRFRARARLDTLRLRLDDALGRELFAAGVGRQLGTADELEDRLPGLVLSPGATDDAALLRFNAASTATVLRLYYHDTNDPGTAITHNFGTATNGRCFYQLRADRTGTVLSALTTSRQALPSARTAAEAYIQGGLGLQMKIEIPYLLNLRELGSSRTLYRTINLARLTLETIPAAENRFFASTPVLVPHLSNRGNRSLGLLADFNGTQLTAAYTRALSTRSNLEQGSYALSLTSYCEAVLQRQIPNDGLLLAPSSATSPEQVVLGGTGHREHPPKLALYLSRTN